MKRFSKAEIFEFLKSWCTKVEENEPFHYVELMMDNHKCIQYYGKQYYVPDGNMFWGNHESDIADYLTNKFCL